MLFKYIALHVWYTSLCGSHHVARSQMQNDMPSGVQDAFLFFFMKRVVRSLEDRLWHCAEQERTDAGGCWMRCPFAWRLLLVFWSAGVAPPRIRTMSEEHAESNSSRHYFDSASTRFQGSFVFSGPAFVVLTVMMVTLVVVIVLGNALVIVAFKVDKSLRRQCNYYFLNLAISDFLVGKYFFSLSPECVQFLS